MGDDERKEGRQATPADTLEEQIMNSTFPKNEREWWAAHEIKRLREDKDSAYLERNRLVSLLASVYPSGIARTNIPGWSEDWHGCVYIDSPCGQLSWHYHDSHAHLFEHLPPYTKPWDGHTTEEKYLRVSKLAEAENRVRK